MDLPMPLVTSDWLAAHLGADDLVVVDVRWYLDGRSGRAAYTAGHLPGAVFADLDTDLAAPASPAGGRHPLPEPADFALAMGRLGIGDHTAVVAYDDTGGMTAGRLWWMLRVLGHPVAVLDGGLAAWPGDLVGGPPPPPAEVTFTERPWPRDRFATADEVASARPGTVVLDARAPERYRGEPNPVDPRFGHIPGARNAPFAANLDPESGRLRSPAALADHYAHLGVDAGADPIAYCGSGVSACLDLLGLELAGHTATRLFVGSWSAWGGDPNRPVETGDPRTDADARP